MMTKMHKAENFSKAYQDSMFYEEEDNTIHTLILPTLFLHLAVQ